MLFRKRSDLTGKFNEMELPLSAEEVEAGLASGELIQRAFPTLTNVQREFLMTGSTQEEWDEVFPPKEDER